MYKRVARASHTDGHRSLTVAGVAVVGLTYRKCQVVTLSGIENIVEVGLAVSAGAETPVEVGRGRILMVAVVVVGIGDSGRQVDGVTGAEVDIVVPIVQLGVEMRGGHAVGEVDVGVETLAGLLAGDEQGEALTATGVVR